MMALRQWQCMRSTWTGARTVWKFCCGARLAGLDIERVSGVDGRTLAPEDPRAALFDRTKLTATEIAIAITHIQIWEEVASSATETGALILEDDVRFMPGFVRNARRALALAHQSPSFYSHAKPQDGKNAASSSVAFSVAKPEDGKNAAKPGDGTIAAGDGDDWPLIWLSAINRGYNSVNDGRTPSAVSMAGEAPNVAPTGWDYFGGMWCYLLSRGAAKRLVTLAHATRALNGPGIGRAIDAWIAHLGPAVFPTLTATPMIAWAPVARHGADSDIQTARAFLPPSTSPPSAHPIAPPTIAQPALLAPPHMSVANPFIVALPSPSADTNIESPPSVGIPPLNSPGHPADTPAHPADTPGQQADTRGQSADASGADLLSELCLSNSTVGGSKPSRAAEGGQVLAAVDGSGQVVAAVDGSGQVVAVVDGSQFGRLGFRGLGRSGSIGQPAVSDRGGPGTERATWSGSARIFRRAQRSQMVSCRILCGTLYFLVSLFGASGIIIVCWWRGGRRSCQAGGNSQGVWRFLRARCGLRHGVGAAGWERERWPRWRVIFRMPAILTGTPSGRCCVRYFSRQRGWF